MLSMDNMNSEHSHPILYSFRRCPYAMRGRLAVARSGLNVELREIVLRNKPAHMMEISPKGTVPVLLTPMGNVVDESLDIMHYALNRHDPDEWLAANEETTNFLIKRNDNEFKKALDRYKYPNRYEGEDCSNMFEKGAEVLEDLNTRLEKNGSLVEDYDTLADFAIFPFIRQFAHVDKDRFYALPLPHLHRWLKRHLDSDLFKTIMKKYDPWQDGDAPLLWPE